MTARGACSVQMESKLQFFGKPNMKPLFRSIVKITVALMGFQPLFASVPCSHATQGIECCDADCPMVVTQSTVSIPKSDVTVQTSLECGCKTNLPSSFAFAVHRRTGQTKLAGAKRGFANEINPQIVSFKDDHAPLEEDLALHRSRSSLCVFLI